MADQLAVRMGLWWGTSVAEPKDLLMEYGKVFRTAVVTANEWVDAREYGSVALMDVSKVSTSDDF